MLLIGDIYYEGTEDEWNLILNECEDSNFVNATVHYEQSSLPDDHAIVGETFTDHWGFTDLYGDFTYKVTNAATDGTGTVSLISVKNNSSHVVVDSAVTLRGIEYNITSVGSKALYNNKAVQSVYIRENVKNIDSYAFYGCSNLKSVEIREGLLTIGSYAFAKCTKLSTFTVKSPFLKKIGSYAFKSDKKLKTLYVNFTVKLTKSGVKKSLKGSSVKTVKVKKSKVKKYKKYFSKKNCGRKVKVKK